MSVTYIVTVSILLVVLLILPDKYESQGVYTPSEHLQSDSLSGLAGSLGSLAGLAGINLNSSKRDSLQIALEIAKSKKFIFDLIEQNALKAKIFAAKSWDKETNTLYYNDSLYDEKTNTWVRDEDEPEPSLFEVYKKLKKSFSISFDEKTSLVKISYTHVSPVFAEYFVSLVEKTLNEAMKQRDMEDAKVSQDLMTQAATNTNYAELRGLLFELVQEQTKKLLLAKSRRYYVLEPIDPPIIPEEKDSPKRGLILIAYTLIFGLVSLLLLFLNNKDVE